MLFRLVVCTTVFLAASCAPLPPPGSQAPPPTAETTPPPAQTPSPPPPAPQVEAAAEPAAPAPVQPTPKPPPPSSAEPSLAAPAAQPAPVPQAPASTGERRAASEWATNDTALKIIQDSEGLRLEAYQYQGQWLIGYGHAKGVTPGMKITKEQAIQYLKEDLRMSEGAVAKAISVAVTENEFGAMVSLCFNIGPLNFAKSSVARLLNAGDRAGAADAFLLWVKGGGQVLPHLEERRRKERALFLS